MDHDSKYGTEVSAAIRSMNIKAVRTAIGCPWQNGVAERWVGNCRRELLDHVIAINESHLKRLLSSYVAYYLSFAKTPRDHISARRNNGYILIPKPEGFVSWLGNAADCKGVPAA